MQPGYVTLGLPGSGRSLEGSTQSGDLSSSNSHALHATAVFALFGKQFTVQSASPAGKVDRRSVERSPGPVGSESRLDDPFNRDSEVGAGDRAFWGWMMTVLMPW